MHYQDRRTGIAKHIFDFGQRMAMSYLKRREAAVMGTFAPFGLKPTGYCPVYQTVKRCERNDIEVYANFDLAVS